MWELHIGFLLAFLIWHVVVPTYDVCIIPFLNSNTIQEELAIMKHSCVKLEDYSVV